MKIVYKLCMIFILSLILTGCQDQKIEVSIYDDSDQLVETIQLEKGDLLSNLPEIQKEGYNFEGWYIDSQRTVTFDIEDGINENISLYPKWIKNSYNITFFMGTFDAINVMSIAYEEEINLPTPQEEGYTFMGWYLDLELTQPMSHDTMPSHGLNLYPKWEIKTFTISYETGLDIDIESQDYVFNQSLDLPVLEEEGLTFLGWYLDDEFKNAFDETKMPAENITLYANWSFLFDIALITDGGSIDDRSYNQIAYEGMEAFSIDNEINSIYIIPETVSIQAYMDAIDLAASFDVQVIIMNGFLFENAAYFAQFEYPDIKFILIDGSPHNIINWDTLETVDGGQPDFTIRENLVSIFYQEEELGFLAGYSSIMEGFDHLGFIGGMPVPMIVRYGIGYIAGAYYAAHEMGLDTFSFSASDYQYENTFAPNYETLTKANQMYLNGVDSIFTVAGGANISVMTSAQANQGWVFGVDVDMSYMTPEVLNSAVKYADVVIYQELYHIFYHTFYGGITRHLGVSNHALGLATDEDSWRFENFTLNDYETIYQIIANGSIQIPNNPEDLENFIDQLGLIIDPDLMDFLYFTNY